MSDNRNATCADRLPDHLESRITHVRRLLAVADAYDADTLTAVTGSAETLPDLLDALDLEHVANESPDAIAEAARESLQELPLGVISQTVFRIELSTGGPADWLEVVCSGDTPNYEPAGDGEHYEPERIVYHFADWFDHAERTLEGDEFDIAARFASTVVPELMG